MLQGAIARANFPRASKLFEKLTFRFLAADGAEVRVDEAFSSGQAFQAQAAWVECSPSSFPLSFFLPPLSRAGCITLHAFTTNPDSARLSWRGMRGPPSARCMGFVMRQLRDATAPDVPRDRCALEIPADVSTAATRAMDLIQEDKAA